MSESRAERDVDFAELYRRLDRAAEALSAEQSTDPAVRSRVLEERAKALSAAREEVREEAIPVVAFTVGGERYGIPVERVVQVTEPAGLSPLPAAPRHVLGAMSSRGRLVVVLDLRLLLGLEGGGMSDLTRVVMVQDDDEVFGLAAEAVDGREDIPRSALVDPLPGPFLYMTRERLAILDLARLGKRDER